MTLDEAGRLDCFARAQQFAVNASTWFAQEAEGLNDRRAAIREIQAVPGHLIGATAWRRRLQHILWHVRLRFRALQPLGRALRP